MSKKKVCAFATVMVLSLSIISGCASDPNRQEPTGPEMAADALIVRPMTLTYSALGLAAWVVTLPFTLPSGNADDAAKEWWVGPFAYTFDRPLGEICEER